MIRNIALLFLLFSNVLFAHQDRIIEIAENGELSGFPEKYMPSNFDIRKWQLTIAGTSYTFPDCIKNNIPIKSVKDLAFSSSWYHQRTPRMPNYLNINVKSKDFSILVALDNAKPFDIDKETLKYKDREKVKFKELSEAEACALLKQ
tara:strand:+ start:56 stop:496 length:441 start_codon:yes stop_codon:yes gene_type:complete